MSDAYTPTPPADEPQGAPERDPALDPDELLPRFKRWDKALDRHWAQWRKESRESFGFVESDQWSDDERAALQEAGKVAVTINRVGVMIDAVCGAEVNNRQQVQYVPREVGDSGANDVLTQGAEYFRDKADTDTEESDAARDAFICGMGWTGTSMDYELDASGLIMVDRVDPLEMAVDAMARKANVVDARYLRRKKIMSREAYEERWPGMLGSSDPDRPDKHVTRTGHGYDDDDADSEDVPNEDEVTVCEYQWYDLQPVHVVALGGKTIELSPQQMQQAMEVAAGVQLHLPSVMRKKRVYYRAFRSGDNMLEAKRLPDDEFTYKCITGKRRRNKGTWYGLVEPMKDPQRWANKFFSEILFVLRTNANGGLIIEEDAVEDTEKFEADFAKADTNVYVPPGTVSGGS
jgi:hypothetical protein